MANHFAISAGHKRTAEAGAEILRAGGNAVDSVLAAAFTAFMAEPIMAQPYGGGFLLVQQQGDAQAHLIDFYGSTPRVAPPREQLDNQAVEANFGQTKQVFHVGAGTIAVSGLAQGFSAALENFGTMSLPELAAQGILLAREGFPLDEHQAGIFQLVAAILTHHPDAVALYGKEGRLLTTGDFWSNPALADVLECWAQEGERFMSQGEAARAVLSLTEERGAVRADDLRDYQVLYPKPLTFDFLGRRVCVNPPPSAGGVLVKLGLALLNETASPLEVAKTLEKIYHARKALGHIEDPSKGEALLAPEVIARLREHPKAYRGTTHISAIDSKGLGASLSLTNGAGSGLIAPGTGIHLNDMLGEPELIPKARGTEAFRENVRLCSMMSPTIMQGQEDFLVLGAAGSTRIPSALIQTLLSLTQGRNAEATVDRARVHYEDKLMFEDFFTPAERADLCKAYPEAEPWDERAVFFGGVNIARNHQGSFEAAADPRRGGLALLA